MSTVPLHELPDQAEAAHIAETRKADALEHWNELLKDVSLEQTTSLRIGFNIHYLEKHGLFGILGFATEGEAIAASGWGRSTWYQSKRLAEQFDTLTLEQFTSMKVVNAIALADLPESKRKSREWIRLAGSESVEKFQQRVDEEMDGRAKASDGKEHGTILKMPMPLSRKKHVQEGLQEYAEQTGIDKEDIGKALENLVTEKRGETTLIGAITIAVQQAQAAKKLRESYLSAEECLEKVYVILDDMVILFNRALMAARGELEDESAGLS